MSNSLGIDYWWNMDEVNGLKLDGYFADLEKTGWTFVAIVPRGLDDSYRVISKRRKPTEDYSGD